MNISARRATVLLSVVIAVIGGVLVVAFWNDDRTIAELCRYGGTVLVASVALTLVFEFGQKLWFVNEVFPVFRNWHQSGLTQATLNFQDEEIDWRKLFQESTKLRVVVWYAETWRHSKVQHLREFKDQNKTLEVILPDHKDGSLMEHLARRLGKSVEATKERVVAAEKDFTNEYGGTVYLCNQLPMFSFYLFDRTVVLATYSHQRGRSNVLTLTAESKKPIYDWVHQEFEALRESCCEEAAR